MTDGQPGLKADQGRTFKKGQAAKYKYFWSEGASHDLLITSRRFLLQRSQWGWGEPEVEYRPQRTSEGLDWPVGPFQKNFGLCQWEFPVEVPKVWEQGRCRWRESWLPHSFTAFRIPKHGCNHRRSDRRL